MQTLSELGLSYEEATYQAERRRCSECGGQVVIAWGGKWGIDDYVIRCGVDEKHQGYAKDKSWSQKWDDGEPIPIFISNNIERMRRRKVEQKYGGKLAVYQGSTSLTKEQATMILRSIWPKAPEVEVFKAAMTCQMYGLNPLMKHVFLICFNEGKANEKWALVLGIGATRLIASRPAARRGGYTYKDGPRIMTDKEQETILGEVDQKNIVAITVLSDKQGNQAPGYGRWLKTSDPYGADKGNTRQNMAFIRSERNAFDRLFPGEMPAYEEVMDERYAPEVDSTTGEIIEQGNDQNKSEVVSKPSNGKPQVEAGKPVESPATEKTKVRKFEIDLLALEFKDVGEFKAACLKYFNLQGDKLAKEISMYDLNMVSQRKKAWQAIVAVYGQKKGGV